MVIAVPLIGYLWPISVGKCRTKCFPYTNSFSLSIALGGRCYEQPRCHTTAGEGKGCYWHLPDRGRGCCSTSHSAQDARTPQGMTQLCLSSGILSQYHRLGTYATDIYFSQSRRRTSEIGVPAWLSPGGGSSSCFVLTWPSLMVQVDPLSPPPLIRALIPF